MSVPESIADHRKSDLLPKTEQADLEDLGEPNPSWVAFFTETRRLAALARARGADSEQSDADGN